MKLTKRSDTVNKDEKQLGISRRAFMRNSSIAAAGGAVGVGMFAPGMMKKAQAKSVDLESPIEINGRFVLTAQWAVVFMPKYKKVYGQVKNRHSITRLMRGDTVLKGLHYVNTDMVLNVLNIQ